MIREPMSKAQLLEAEEGIPVFLKLTKEQREQGWKNTPKVVPLAYEPTKPKTTDPGTEKLLQEIASNAVKKKNSKDKMSFESSVDRTGQRWNTRLNKWVPDFNQQPGGNAMMSITTNTRGATQMPQRKDYAEMTGPELVAAYNKISGKEPIKKFKDKGTALTRLAELETARAAAVKEKVATARVAVAKEKATNGQSKAPATASTNKLAAEFSARPGSFREKLLIALDENFKKMVHIMDLLKAVYGSKNTENSGALLMVIKGAQTTIDKNKLPYQLKKEKNDAKELSFGLFAK